jgi:hypothetical protein
MLLDGVGDVMDAPSMDLRILRGRATRSCASDAIFGVGLPHHAASRGIEALPGQDIRQSAVAQWQLSTARRFVRYVDSML